MQAKWKLIWSGHPRSAIRSSSTLSPMPTISNAGKVAGMRCRIRFLSQKVAGASKLSNGEWAGQRGDMVLENDIVFGRMMELLETLPDPRNGGKPMIENTLVIFTSDNDPTRGNKMPRVTSLEVCAERRPRLLKADSGSRSLCIGKANSKMVDWNVPTLP